MRFWMLPVPIWYRMTVLDDGIGRYRYRMTVFSRYCVPYNGEWTPFLAFSLSLSPVLAFSLSLSFSRLHLRLAFLLPLPCSHFLFPSNFLTLLRFPKFKGPAAPFPASNLRFAPVFFQVFHHSRVESEDIEEKIGQERGNLGSIFKLGC